MPLRRSVLFLACLFLLFEVHILEAKETSAVLRLPYPQALFHKVEFWKSIYTRYSTTQGILHDADDLSIIYEDIQLPANRNQSVVNERRYEIRQALFNVLRKRGQNLSAFERKILSKFPKYASRSRLLQATENIRFQLGQSDRFKEGLINSGRYMRDIEKIVKEEEAPDFLKYLPHVESSFQEKAMSKFGAAGLWQLMPKTGKQFLKVNYSVDERLDPWIATRAGIRYLKQNYKRLNEWPLALTAYNHGAGGVLKAVRTLGTTDIAEIAFQYSTPSFGFASRNFYAQFLAAVQVAQDYRTYFGAIELAQPFRFEEKKLTQDTFYRALLKQHGFDEKEFKEINLALRPPVLKNQRPIPKGTTIRIPEGSNRKPRVLVASLDKKIVGEALKSEPSTPDIRIEAPKSEKSVQAVELKDAISNKTKIEEKETATGSAVVDASIPELKDQVVDSRYDVKDFANGRGWIKIEINETISQIADWMGVEIAKIREWNGLDAQGQVRLGQRVILRFDDQNRNLFVQSRRDYHQQIREDFFSRYDVENFVDYEIKVGENLWSICYQKFDIPPWLLEEFNPETSITELKPGVRLKIPVIAEKFAQPQEGGALQSAEKN